MRKAHCQSKEKNKKGKKDKSKINSNCPSQHKEDAKEFVKKNKNKKRSNNFN